MQHVRCSTRLLAVALALVVCWLGTSCVPPDLLEVNGETERQVEFTEVATVIRQSCATGVGCHGASGSTNFKVEGDTQATDEQVRAALEGVSSSRADSRALIEPGDADNSEIYLRLIGEEGQTMPPIGGGLDEELIETVRLWIDQGANYE